MDDKIRSTRLLLQLVKVPENMEILLGDGKIKCLFIKYLYLYKLY